MKKFLLAMLAIICSGCMFTAVQTLSRNVSAQTAENFTVNFTTMDYNGEQSGKIHGVNTTGTPILKIQFEGVTNEEITAALNQIDDYLYLDGKSAVELGGAHYFVNSDVTNSTVGINLPDVKFYANFTGTNWDYALDKFDYGMPDPYAHLQNYKIELKAGITIGGKTLGEDYARYYNNIAHNFTTSPIEAGKGADMQFTDMRVNSNGTSIDLIFDQNLISKQIMWYVRGSHADLTATLVDLYKRVNSIDPNLFVSQEEFAAAVVMPAAKSLRENIHFSYTDVQGEKVNYSLKETGGDVHYIKDGGNESVQWISVNFSDQKKIDVSKPVFVTVDGGFIAPSGATVKEDTQIIWDGSSVTYPVTDFTPSLSVEKLAVSETAQISLTFTPENGYVENVEYTSQNDAVATVSAEGIVTAVAMGETKITVKVLPYNLEKTVQVVVIQGQSLEVQVNAGYSPEEGDTLDKSQFTAKVTMSDGSVRDVASDKLEISGYDPQKVGTQTLTVKYGELTDTVEIMVKAKPVVLESIEVSVAEGYSPEVGQELDYSKFTLKLKYSDGSEKTETVTVNMVSGYNKDTEGEQTLTITYEGKSATVKITVKAVQDIQKTGCNGIVAYETLAVCITVLFAAVAIAIIKKVKSR